jgi:hypothetical protein
MIAHATLAVVALFKVVSRKSFRGGGAPDAMLPSEKRQRSCANLGRAMLGPL